MFFHDTFPPSGSKGVSALLLDKIPNKILKYKRNYLKYTFEIPLHTLNPALFLEQT